MRSFHLAFLLTSTGAQVVVPGEFTNYDGVLATSPPKYPSPWAAGTRDWAAAYVKARAMVKQLTLAELVNVTSGIGWQGNRATGETGSIPRLGFRGIAYQDGPVGVRKTDGISVFPAGINAGATFDRNLNYLRGQAMGREFSAKGVDGALSPVSGPLGRDPRGGRNWEGFSNDPYHSGKLMASTIVGLQENVMATAKHFIGNEQEHFRQDPEARGYGYNITAPLSSNIDDKTLHMLYMWPFADAIRAGASSIMCSYNRVNNTAGCGNSYLLNHLLKSELGFEGFVMSDWQADHGGAGGGAILEGLDQSMPGDTVFSSGDSFFGTNLTIAVLNGTVPQWRLEDAATRILAAFYLVGRDKKQIPINFSSYTAATFGNEHYAVDSPIVQVNEHVNVRGDHAKLIREIGRASIVLLKNNGVLPLKGTERQIALIGNDAGSNSAGANGCSNRGCFNGTNAMGWGSGTANFPYLVTPEQAITNYVTQHTNSNIYTITDNYNDAAIKTLATQSDVAIVFVGADSGEGFIVVDSNYGDRKNLTLWQGGDRLIRNVTSLMNNVVLVLHTPGTVEIEEYKNNPNVTAILWAGLPGQESGNALVDVLYGKYNPGGKLPFTMIANNSQVNTKILTVPNNGLTEAPQQDFTEGQLIDYRYFDAKYITPTFPFGFGLSYTNFTLRDLKIKKMTSSVYKPSKGMTKAAPQHSTLSLDPKDYLFPNESFPRVSLFIYPYLNTTDLKKASGDVHYNTGDTRPATARSSEPQAIHPAGGGSGGNPSLWETVFEVSIKVKNSGKVAGSEVVQLYLELGPDEPPKQLRGFDRLYLAAGEEKTLKAELMRRDISVWDVVTQNWIQPLNPKIHVGTSSRDLPFETVLQ